MKKDGVVIELDAAKAKRDGADEPEGMDSGGARQVWAKQLARSLGIDPGKTFVNGSGRPVHILDEARCEWVLGVNRARHASDGYASTDIELWDVDGATPRLVAYGTQVMFFTFPSV